MMASLHLNELRSSSTVKTTGEAIPRQSTRAIPGNCNDRQGGPSQSMTEFRPGENFTAEKMMQKQAGVKLDLQIVKTKLQKSEDQVRTLESKVQDMNNKNLMLKVKHKQGMKLWQGIDSNFLSTTTFCDQLAETLKLLDGQVQEAESGKIYLEDKLAEGLEFFQQTECRFNDLFEKKKAAEETVKECEARNELLQTMIREMEQTILSDSIKLKALAVEKDDRQQQLTKAVRMNEDNEVSLRTNRCEIDALQNKVTCQAKESTDLQHLNSTLSQANGELELEVKGLQLILATARTDNETLQEDSEMLMLKTTDLENVNASATASIEKLVAEKANVMQQSEKDKIALEKVVHELKQYLVEYQLDMEAVRRQLQEARKENERFVDVIQKEESKFASLQDEMKRLSQECTEKSKLMSCMSQNEANLRRENVMVQEQFIAVEAAAKSLEIQFDLQLESKQKESAKHLVEYQLDMEAIRGQLQEAVKENERLVDIIEKEESKVSSLQDEMKRLSQECTEKSKLISCTAQNEANLRRENDTVQEKLTAAEAAAKRLEIEFKLHLESKQKQSAKHLIEYQLDTEFIGRQLQEAVKENERLVDSIGKEESKFSSLQDEMKRLSRECTEKSQLISRMSQNEANLREENAMVQELLTAAENTAKSLEIKFNVQLESKQEESTQHLEDVSQRYNQEIAALRRKYEMEIEEGIAKERIKGEDALNAARKASDEGMATALEKFDQRWLSLQDDCECKISHLREGHEKETMKIVSVHSEETDKQHEELHRANKTIRKLQEQEQEKTKIVSIHSDEVRKMEEDLQTVKEMIRKLREGHEQDKERTVSIHSDEIHKKEVDLQNASESINELLQSYEQEKTKLATIHAEEIHKMQEEHRTGNETCHGNIAELHRKVEEIRKSKQEDMEKMHQKYEAKMTEEKSRLHQAMKEMQVKYEDLLITKAEEQKAQLEKLDDEQEAQIKNVQNSLSRELNEWRSKALGWEIQLKEALQQISTRKGSEEDKDLQVVNQDFKMTVTEVLVCTDIPTPVVTPMTKDKMSQQPNVRLKVKNTVDLTDTTDEDADKESQKSAQQGKRKNQQSPRPEKRKMDIMSLPDEGPRKYGRTSRNKGSLDNHDKVPIRQHHPSTEPTKAMEVCSSGNKKSKLMTKDNEPHQQQIIKRGQHSVDESRRQTGLTCLQQSNLHPMPGPTHQKGTNHNVLGFPLEQKKTVPKRRVRKSTEDVSQEKIELIKTSSRAPSPAISDLFEIDGLVPYYKGDDPYAFG